TSRAAIPLNLAVIDHQCEGEARVSLGFLHDRVGSVVDEVSWPVPDHEDSINAPADHVSNLAVDLSGIGRVVTYVHVAWLTKPQHQVGENFGTGARIKQRVDVNLADITRTQITVRLRRKSICSAGIVRGLRC